MKVTKYKVKTLTKLNNMSNKRMQKKNAELKRLRSQVCHMNKVIQRLKHDKNTDLEAQIKLLKHTLLVNDEEYKGDLETLRNLREENDWLHDIYRKMENNEVILHWD